MIEQKLIYIISIIILVVSMAFILLNIRLERQDKVESNTILPR